MKKLLSLTLIAALLLTLAACGKPYAPIPNPPLVLGEKYLTDLDYEQALLQFDQAIVIDPKNPRGHPGKADALLHLSRQADAAAALQSGAKIVATEQRAELKDAVTEIEKSPEDGYVGLASAYEKLGWKDIALVLLKRVTKEFERFTKVAAAYHALAEQLNIAVDATQESTTETTTTTTTTTAAPTQAPTTTKKVTTTVAAAGWTKKSGELDGGGYAIEFYDAKGKLMRREFLYNGVDDGYEIYVYDTTGKLVRSDTYNVNGTIHHSDIYDANGYRVGYDRYDANGNLEFSSRD